MRAQVAIEFMILFGFAALIFIFVMAIIFEVQLNLKKQEKSALADDMGYFLYREIQVARESEPGYNRSFVLPADLEGHGYDLRSSSCEEWKNAVEQLGGDVSGLEKYIADGTEITLRVPNWENATYETVRQVSPHKGTFIKGGWNTIMNVRGQVYLNAQQDPTTGEFVFAHVCYCNKLNVPFTDCMSN
jgi:hypothetical protein